MKEGGGAFPPVRPDRFHIQPALGLRAPSVLLLLYVTGPSPARRGWWSDYLPQLELTADSPSLFCWDLAVPVVGVGLIVPALPHPQTRLDVEDKPSLNPLLLSRSSIFDARSTTTEVRCPNKISKISEAHTLGHARAKRVCTLVPGRAYGRSALHPLMAESWHHPRTLKHRLLVRDPRARGPRGCPDGADKQRDTRGASLPRGLGRAGRRRPGCEDEVSDAVPTQVALSVRSHRRQGRCPG